MIFSLLGQLKNTRAQKQRSGVIQVVGECQLNAQDIFLYWPQLSLQFFGIYSAPTIHSSALTPGANDRIQPSKLVGAVR